LDVFVGVEQRGQATTLLVGDQGRCRCAGFAGGVQRVTGPTPVAVGGLLDPASAPVQSVASEAHDVDGFITATVSGNCPLVAVVNPSIC